MSAPDLASRVATAIDSVTGKPFLSEISDYDLRRLMDLYWGCQLDLQNEYLRRQIEKEGK